MVWRDEKLGLLKTGVYHPAFRRRLISVPTITKDGGGFFTFRDRHVLLTPDGKQHSVTLSANGLYIYQLRFTDKVPAKVDAKHTQLLPEFL